MNALPTILYTQAKDPERNAEAELTTLVQKSGWDACFLPCIQFEKLPLSKEDLTKGVSSDWVFLTSMRAVSSWVEALEKEQMPLSTPVAVIGKKTAEIAQRKGLNVQFVPAVSGPSERFFADFEEKIGIKGLRIFLPRAERARDVLPDRIRKSGGECTVLSTYRTVCVPDLAEQWGNLLKQNIDFRWVVFASGSSVDCFLGQERFRHTFTKMNTQIATLGPVTTEAVHKQGLRVGLESGDASLVHVTKTILSQAAK